MATMDDVQKRRERLQQVSSNLLVLQERQRQIGTQLQSVNDEIAGIVGDEDPQAFLKKLQDVIAETEVAIDRGLQKAEEVIATMKE